MFFAQLFERLNESVKYDYIGTDTRFHASVETIPFLLYPLSLSSSLPRLSWWLQLPLRSDGFFQEPTGRYRGVFPREDLSQVSISINFAIESHIHFVGLLSLPLNESWPLLSPS